MDVFYSGLKLIIVDCLTAVMSPLLGIGQSEGNIKQLSAHSDLFHIVCFDYILVTTG